MADPELLRLEKILLQARARLDRITGSFSDPTLLKVAEDLCAKQPRLSPHLDEMQANLVAALAPVREPMGHGVHVSITPKRGEGLGFVGRTEGIAAWAVALLELG